jgi:hypothetical protein
MSNLVLAGDDDDLGFGLSDIANAARGIMPGRRGRRGGRRAMPARYTAPAPRYTPSVPSALQVAPGGVAPQAGLYPIGLAPFVFLPATGTAPITARENPQINFRAQSVKVIVLRSAGATGSVPLLISGAVGIKQMLIGENPIAIEVWSPTATEANILWPQTRPGNTYRMTIGMFEAVPAGETVTVLVTFFGTAYQ